MIDHSIAELKVLRLAELPVTVAVIPPLEISAILDRLAPQPLNWVGDLRVGPVVIGWRAFLLSPGDHRLNQVESWVEQRLDLDAACLGPSVRAFEFSDDRLADLLEKLSQAQLWSQFELELHQRIIRVDDLQPDCVRLDSTTRSTDAAIRPEGW